MTFVTIELAKLEQVLSALEYHTVQTRPLTRTQEAITILRSTMEQAEKQEPLVTKATRLWNNRDLWTCPADVARDLMGLPPFGKPFTSKA